MPTQTQVPGSSQPQIDPTALNLARAIRQVESGDNPNAKGASGEWGIGQWMPGNYEAAAKKYGLDASDKSLTNQQHIIYNQVEEQLKQGKTQSQVASWWNSGKYDPTGNVGVNKEGVKYDTPAYVEKVKQAYLKATQGQFVNPSAPQQTGGGFVQSPPPVQPTADTPQTPQQDPGLLSKIGSGVQGFLNSVESPFVGLGAIPVQALAKLTGQPDPYAKGIPGALGGNVSVTPLDLEKKAGDAAQVGSYFVPGSGVLGAAGMGVLQGAGSAMSQGGDLAQTAVGAGEGALLGGAAAGATKLAGMGISKLGSLLSGDSAEKAVNGIRDAYASALNLNAGERAFEGRTGKDLAQVLVDNEAPLARYENGTLDAGAAIEKLQTKLAPLNEQAQQILGNPQGVVNDISLPDVLDNVNARIAKLSVTQAEKNKAMATAKDLIEAEMGAYGESVSPKIADQIKQGFWGTTFKRNVTSSDALHSNVAYLIGNEMKTATEKSVAGTDAGNVLGGLNAQRSDLVDAIKRLTKLDGVKLLKGGRLGNMAGGLTGTIIGSSVGGIPGGLAGDYFGTKAAQFLNDPATKIAIAKGRAKAMGTIPGLVGKTAKPIGGVLQKTGQVVKKSARGAGLLTNLLTK